MAFISLSTTNGQVAKLVNTDAIRSIAVRKDEVMAERSLLVTFLDGTTEGYRPVSKTGMLDFDVHAKSATVLLQNLQSYIEYRERL